MSQEAVQRITMKSLNETIFMNPKGEVAKSATRLLWGQGWDFDVIKDDNKDEEKTKEVRKGLTKAGFDKVVLRNENAMSKFGYQINSIHKLNNGELRINEANPKYKSRVAKIEMKDDISAFIWTKFQWDDIAYTLYEKWDRLKVVRSLSTNGESVSLQGFNAEVPAELRIKEVWNHNLGILPLSLYKNLEVYVETPSQMGELADDWNVRNIPLAINQTFRTEIKEQLLDTTKVYGNFSKAQLKKLKQKGVSYDQQLLAQMFIHVPSRGEGTSKLVEVQQAQLTQLAPLIEARKQNVKDYWNGCGYTYLNGDEENDTNASTLFAKGKDIETTKEKRNLRQVDYAEFIKKFMVAMNLISYDEMEDYNVVFTIKENVVQSAEQVIDAELSLVDAGLQTKAEALARIRDLNIKEAEAKVKAASKEHEEAEAKKMEQFQALSGDGDEPKPAGEPNDPKLKGVNTDAPKAK